MKIEACVRCGRQLKASENIHETGDPGVIVYTHMRTAGVRPLVKAKARRRRFCTPCSISIAFGPLPDGAFNQDVHEGLSEIAEQCPALKDVAWEQRYTPPSRPRLMPGSKPDSTLTPKAIPTPFSEAS